MGAVETIRTAVAGALEGLIPLPERAAKPRPTGVTHVVDPGLTRVEADGPDGARRAARRRRPARLGLGAGHRRAGGQARRLPRARRRADARRHADRARLAPRARRRSCARRCCGSASATSRSPRARWTCRSDDKRRLIQSLARGLHGVRRGRQQGRAARAVRASSGCARPCEALDAGAHAIVCEGRVSGDAGPLLARRVDPRRAGRGAGRRGGRRAADLRGAAALAAGLAGAPLRLRRRPRQHPARGT